MERHLQQIAEWKMTFGGGPTGGYIIDYTTIPRAVFRWLRQMVGQDAVITPLPDGVRLLYTDFPLYEPVAHVREFTVEEVAYLDLEALDYMHAAEFFENIWEDAPEESPEESPESPSSPSPNVPNTFGLMEYNGQNWQETIQVPGTVTVTEIRSLSTNCP